MRIFGESGTEPWRLLAAEKLGRVASRREELNLPVSNEVKNSSDATMYIHDSEFQHQVRMTGGQIAHVIGGNSSNIYFYGVDGRLLKIYTGLSGGIGQALVGMAANNKTFLFDSLLNKLDIFQDGALVRAVTTVQPAGTIALPAIGFVPITKGLVSYNGKRAVFPAYYKDGPGTLTIAVYNEYGISYHNILADRNDTTYPRHLIGTPDLSYWGVLIQVGVDAVVQLFNPEGTLTQVVYSNCFPFDAAISQDGTLVVGYERSPQFLVNRLGVEYSIPPTIEFDQNQDDLFPCRMSSDAKVLLVGRGDPCYLLQDGVGQSLSGSAQSVSLDGTAYATRISGTGVRVVTPDGTYVLEDSDFTASQVPVGMSGASVVLAKHGTSSRQLSISPDTFQRRWTRERKTGQIILPSSFFFDPSQYDNIYSKLPPI